MESRWRCRYTVSGGETNWLPGPDGHFGAGDRIGGASRMGGCMPTIQLTTFKGCQPTMDFRNELEELIDNGEIDVDLHVVMIPAP